MLYSLYWKAWLGGQEIHCLYGSCVFNTSFHKSRHWTLLLSIWIQSETLQLIYIRSIYSYISQAVISL
jgi:hypothetical protein